MTAETVAAKIATCFSVFITKNSPTQTPIGRQGRDKEGKPIESIRPGMIEHLRPGESVETANPSRSITSAKEFVEIQEKLSGAGLGLSYELISRDFSKATFSAARQGHLEDRRTFLPIQAYMMEHFCRPVWKGFVDAVVLAGLIKIPDYFSNKELYRSVDWIAQSVIELYDWIKVLEEEKG